MGTTAHQGLAPRRLEKLRQQGGDASEAKVNSCFAYAAHREVVGRLWPHLHRAASGDDQA
jgi:hypothetical protein